MLAAAWSDGNLRIYEYKDKFELLEMVETNEIFKEFCDLVDHISICSLCIAFTNGHCIHFLKQLPYYI